VPDGITQVYRFDTLEKYSFWERLRIRAADIIFYAAISLIGRTIRWEVEGQEHLDAAEASGKPAIFCLWHNRIFGGTYFLRGPRHCSS
jgi:lysophospholipid acyltransferase (LPLAT)-like uncharacterized protein